MPLCQHGLGNGIRCIGNISCTRSTYRTSENLATELKKITDQWKISSKVHCAITDGASNIKGAVRNNQWNNLVCLAHRLNLVVSCAIDAVDEVKEIIEQVKNVVSFFRKSTKASEKLRQIQASFNLPEHKLIQQVSTRWNSAFYMLERYLEQQEPIRMTLCTQNRNDLVIPAEKNSLIEGIIVILRPFEAVTTELSAEKNVSASKIIPLARGLQKITASGRSGTSSLALRHELTAQMATRFANIEEKGVVAIATLLDPRFKIPFSSDSAVERMKQRIISDASAMAPQSQPTDQQQGSEDPDSATSNPVWELFEEQAVASASRIRPSISALSELEQYFKLAVLPRKEDPLMWWKQNSHVFPLLQNVARVYLSTVATSVPSERLFSKAGELISAKRNRIKAKNVDMILFLNKYC